MSFQNFDQDLIIPKSKALHLLYNKIPILILAIIFGLTGPIVAKANSKYAGIVIDAKTGRTLYKYNADSKRYPASLTKMMTVYLIFEALERGKIKKTTRFRISRNAVNEQPSKIGFKVGQTITVEQAIYALIVKSANDVATATGEFLGGSEEKFAHIMTKKAHSLRMTNTQFKNAHGLPNSRQKTTARDMARLGLALREHFPQYYHYFSNRSFNFGKKRYNNYNHLLGKVRGVDGIKTGYTRASGFNLVSSLKKDGRSIVAVVMGGKSSASRNAQMKKLVNQYIRKASKSGKGNFMKKTRISGLVSSVKEIMNKKIPVPVIYARSNNTMMTSAYAPVALAVPVVPVVPVVPAALAVPVVSGALAVPVVSGALAVPVVSGAAIDSAPQTDIKKPIVARVKNIPLPAESIDSIKTASTTSSPNPPSQSGWIVQVGISPHQEGALNLLTKATKTGDTLIRQAKPFTMAFVKDGEKIYRARFGGFPQQAQAVIACKNLKKKGINCWAAEAQ